MSQSDFSKVLNWGEKTITRYENHQVQDRAHDYIINLDGVCYDVVEYDDIAYKFRVESEFEVESLSKENIESAETIVHALGDVSTNQIIEIMHEEEAFKDVPKNQLIQYTYAEQLSID